MNTAKNLAIVVSLSALISSYAAELVNRESVEPRSFAEGLVAHYDFNGDAADASGNGNNGILHDATPTVDRNGNAEGAYHFNGTSAYVEVPDSDSLREVGQTVTLSAWVKPETRFKDKWISVLCKGGGSDDRQYSIQFENNKWVIYHNAAGTQRYDTAHDISLNKWSFVAMTFTPTLISAYLDGEIIGTMIPVGSIVEGNDPLYIGADPTGEDEYFIGDMDEVRVYNRCLSVAEVRALSNGDCPVASTIGENAWVYRYDVVDGVGITQTSTGRLSTNFEIPATIDGRPVVTIGRYGFADNTDIETVTIPATIAEIGDSAFVGCSNLVHVTLSADIGTLTVGGNAFRLSTEVAIAGKAGYVFGGWIDSMGADVPNPFHRAEAVTITPTWKKIETATIDGRIWTYVVSNDGFATIGNGVDVAAAPTLTGDVTIPDNIGGYTVVGIGRCAFSGCEGITSLTIPSSVTSVGVGAFGGCAGLTNLVIESESLSCFIPGLMQAKFNTRFDITSAIDDADNADNVSGVISAYQKVTASPWEFSDPQTGDVYAWNGGSTTFAYVGQMFLEAGKTYVFGAHFDGNAYVKIDQQLLVVEHYYDGTSANVAGMIHVGSYLCISSAWYTVDIRLMDAGGDKGPYGNIWASDFGLGYRDDGSTNMAQGGWSRLLDPGDGSLFRCDAMRTVFVGCSNLVSVTMPWSMATRMSSLFPNAYDKLESVVLTGDVAEIPEKAFAGCARLVSIMLPRSIGTLALGANVCDATTEVVMEAADGCYFGGWTNATGVIIADPFHSPTAVTVSPRWMNAGAEYAEHLIFIEDFERESMEFDLTTVGTFPYPASIQDGMGVNGSRGFGFGRSSCNKNAWFDYVNTLTASFKHRYFITRVEFDEMERYGNTGSVGNIIINRNGNERIQNHDFCRKPTNDGVADTEWRHHDAEIGKMATNISFQVVDITGKSEAFIDNVKVYGRLARQCAVSFDANGGSGHMAEQSVLEGDDLTLADNSFERAGYTFLGWSVSANGDVAYGDGATISAVSAAMDGMVLHAAWEQIIVLPTVAVDAAPEAVMNAIEMAGFADAVAIKEVIGGSAMEYGKFKEWAQSVKRAGSSSGAVAGEVVVVANTNAATAYLLGAERLFENAPKIEFEEVGVADGEDGGVGTSRPTMTVSVSVKDGEESVKCAAEKVKEMFEATSDLSDWSGAAKLMPLISVEDGEGATMRFKVAPGDGTAAQAFLRIRK